jgi:hypothetical protein
VQAALDYIPDGNTDPVTVFLRKGTYREIIFSPANMRSLFWAKTGMRP